MFLLSSKLRKTTRQTNLLLSILRFLGGGSFGGQSGSRRAISVFEKKQKRCQHGDGNEYCWQACLSKREDGSHIV
jgi:hypothetical protein